MRFWLRRFGTTATAVLLGGALSIAFSLVGVQSLLGGLDPGRIDEESRNAAIGLGIPASLRDLGAVWTLSGLVMLVFGLVSAIALIGVAMRRPGSREAALGIYAALAIVMIPLGIGGLMAKPPTADAPMGVLVGLLAAAVVALLAVPATSRAFDEAELARQRKMARKA